MSGNRTYFPGVDGLRAVAILSVFAYHLNPKWLPGGFSGVDIFFVISGFVVSFSLWKDSSTGIREFLARFYCRRILRIYPALIACLVVSAIGLILFVPDSWLGRANKITAISAFFGVSNFVLFRSTDGYFSEGSDYNPFLHTWSLAVEEQFYFFFPLMFVAWVRWRHSTGIRLFLSRATIPVAVVASIAAAATLTSSNQPAAFYLLPSRFWELALGYLIFRIHLGGPDRFVAYRLWLQWIGAGLCLIGVVFAGEVGFPWPGAIFPALGSAALILSVITKGSRRSWFDMLLEHPMTVGIGRMSYSLYLWHWPVIVLAKWTTGLETPWEYLWVLLVTMILALASWRFVEIPAQKSSFLKNLPRAKLIVGAAAITLLISGVVAIMLKSHSRLTLSVTGNRSDWYADYQPDVPVEFDLIPTGFDDILAKSVRRATEAGQSGPRIFLVGDSHASAYWPVVASFAVNHNVEAIVLAKGGCFIAGFRMPVSQMKPACKEFASYIGTYLLKNVQAGDVVLFGSIKADHFHKNIGREFFTTPDRGGFSDSALRQRDRALDEFLVLANQLQSRGANIVLDGLKPNFPSSAYRCSDWFNKENPACEKGLEVSRRFLLERSIPQVEALERVVARVPGTSVWEVFHELCPDSTCYAVKAGRPLFFDTDHLSGHGNKVVYGSLERHLLPLLTPNKNPPKNGNVTDTIKASTQEVGSQ